MHNLDQFLWKSISTIFSDGQAVSDRAGWSYACVRVCTPKYWYVGRKLMGNSLKPAKAAWARRALVSWSQA